MWYNYITTKKEPTIKYLIENSIKYFINKVFNKVVEKLLYIASQLVLGSRNIASQHKL